MIRTAQHYVVDRESAADVVQETWLAVWRTLDRFEERATLKTWVFAILINRARTYAKRAKRQIPFSHWQRSENAVKDEDEDEGDTPIALEGLWGEGQESPRLLQALKTSLPVEVTLAHELRSYLEAAIAQLPTQQRQVMTLHDLEGWTPAEICALLDLSEGNQRVLLHRARTKVRRLLTEYVADDAVND